MNPSTEASQKLAHLIFNGLNRHDGFRAWWANVYAQDQSEIVEGITALIDKELLLPEKHAALLLAQAVVDVWSRQLGRVFESMGSENPRAQAIDAAIDDLRTALDKLR